ncbi:MAG: hypothetical protein U5L96_14825 [Owenweeksia sp.]|nr:hypothetical protein [Owenweeksia sp.]
MNQSDPNQGKKRTGPIAYMARNSIIANLLMVILIGGGIWTMYNIQKEVFPQFQLDIVEVSVVYPGACPCGSGTGNIASGGGSYSRAYRASKR